MKTSSHDKATAQRLELFFDGECPLCVREVGMLRRLDRRERILFTDIAGAEFKPPPDVDYATLMDRIYARRGSTWYEGVEVFRQLYAAVGLGPLVALTRVPGISHGLDAAYDAFAKNRLRLTGRCTDGVCSVREVAP